MGMAQVTRVHSQHDSAQLLTLAQASFIVLLAINDTLGRHGGGTHQWNLHYQDVQFFWRVCLVSSVGIGFDN